MPDDSTPATDSLSNTTAGAQMDERVRRLKTPGDCLIFAKNAADRGRLDLACQARRHAVYLRSDEHEPTTPLTRAWYEALYASEQVMAHRDRAVKASPSRSLLRKYGARGAIERSLANGGADAYARLKNSGMEDLSFENTVLRFPDEFTVELVDRARASLAEY